MMHAEGMQIKDNNLLRRVLLMLGPRAASLGDGRVWLSTVYMV